MFSARPLSGHPGVELLRTAASLLGRPLMWAHFVRVDDLLVDTGNARIDPAPLLRHMEHTPVLSGGAVVHTHLHEDHCGNTARLVERGHGVAVRVPAPRRRSDLEHLDLAYRVYWGRPLPCTGRVMEPGDAVTTAGGRTVTAVATPGHTRCHLAFRVEPDDLLVTGDAVPLPREKLFSMPEEDYRRIIRTLRGLRRDLGASTVVHTAHREILDHPRAAMDERIARMESVVERVERAWRRTGSVKQTAREALGKDRPPDLLLAPRISRRNTVRSIIGDEAAR